jgi:hypothetical protein
MDLQNGGPFMILETEVTLDNLSALPLIELKKAFARCYGKPPPKSASQFFLKANIAYAIQANSQSGLSNKSKRYLTKIAKEVEKNPSYQIIPKQDIRAGTRLVREWHGTIHEVTVLEERFEYQGKRYRSLSRIATEITGTKWSGPVFFGLKK